MNGGKLEAGKEENVRDYDFYFIPEVLVVGPKVCVVCLDCVYFCLFLSFFCLYIKSIHINNMKDPIAECFIKFSPFLSFLNCQFIGRVASKADHVVTLDHVCFSDVKSTC